MRDREPLEWPECIVTLESAFGLLHFVPDDVTVIEAEGGLFMGWGELRRYEAGVVYRGSEALRLVAAGLSSEELRAVHDVKRVLGVGVGQVAPRPRKIWTEDQVCAAWAGWSSKERESYTTLRVRALELQGASQSEASLEQRQVAASWAAERVARREVPT